MGARELLEKNPRLFWGHVIRVLIERGWNPPPPDQRAADDLLEAMERVDERTPLLELRGTGLSPAELAVARELVQGASNEEICEALGLAPSTVKYHLANIYSKLGVTSRTRAVLALLDAA